MKTLVFLILSSMCLGQSAISSTPVPLQIPDHPEHASVHAMLPEQTLLLNGVYAVATGEQDLLEVYKPDPEVSLGTIARICREDAQDKRCIYQNK
jgi:hypothetical protein